ncbi:MAG: glycosyltransferase family 2 protein, partial [Actinomycetes bacterium]
MIVAQVIFWLSLALLVFAQLGYPLLLGIWAKLSRRRAEPPQLIASGEEPFVTLVIAAHREQSVIAARIANARQL